MPRANRHFLSGQLWHITHRYHERSFLFKFPRDRRRYLRWLFEAKKRFGLCVLNTLIELADLSALCGFARVVDFQRAHRQWVEKALLHDAGKRDARWSEALAVGSQAFVENVKRKLAMKAKYRNVDEADGSYALREPTSAYRGSLGVKTGILRTENAILWA